MSQSSQPDEQLRSNRKLIDSARLEAESLTSSDPGLIEIPTDNLPGYRLLHEIHRGGQGIVYRAYQEATGRTVAVKVMREGPFAGPADRMRFEREVRLLAAVRHPNIVAIHDSGQAGGHFFYVMDYIAGEALDEHVRTRKLDLQATLRLVAKICDAVNAAHLRGIVHRDLKPGNVRIDEAGEPYVLDFGLARGAGAGWSDSGPTAVTVTGQFVGSLQWASPEQTEGIPERVDVRTDVYSLGVMLYQLLTGRFPYNVSGPMWQVVANIRQAEPEKPGAFRAEIDDDLETIIFRCLQKDCDRRYQTAGELARDLRHYLAGEAIEARRDSAWYVFRKALRRHRAAGLVVVAGLAGLLVFGVVSFSLYRKAEAARMRASLEASRAAETVRFLRGLLRSIDPDRARGRDTSLLREALDETDQRIRRELTDQPLLAADLHETMGEAFYHLGDDDRAESHHLAALELRRLGLGPEDPSVDRSLRLAALSRLRWASDYPSVQSMLEEVLRRRERRDPQGSEAVAESLADLGRLWFERGELDRADEYQRRAMRILNSLPRVNDDLRAQLLLERSHVAMVRNDFRTADEFLSELNALLERDRGATDRLAMARLAYALGLKAWHQGRMQNVRERLTRALDIQRRLLGDTDHVEIARTLDVLGLYLLDNEPSEFEAAGQYLKEAWDIRTRRVPGDNADLADSAWHYGYYLVRAGDLAGGEELLERALALSRKLYGKDGLQVAKVLRSLAALRGAQGRLEEKQSLLEDAVRIASGYVADDPRELASCLKDQGEAMLMSQRFAEAVGVYTRAIDVLRGSGQDTGNELLGECLRQLGQAERALGRYAEAVVHMREALTIYRSAYGPKHPFVATVLNGYARTLNKTGDPESFILAESAAREAIEIIESSPPSDRVRVAEFRTTLAVSLESQGRSAEAEEWLLKAWSDLSDQPECSRVRVLCVEALSERYRRKGAVRESAEFSLEWGTCLLALGRLEEAESRLLEAENGFTEAFGPDAEKTRACLRQLSILYERKGDPDKADAYRQRCEPALTGPTP